MRYSIILVISLLSACTQDMPHMKSENQHPFVGCWESEDEKSREVWNEDPSGWLFGYALNRDENGTVKFFEQMRFEDGTLTVTGPNDDPTMFRLVESGAKWVFENADHDYPQRIIYVPSDGRLDASISLLDGSNKIKFKKHACP